MYDELIKRLRYLAKVYSICDNENTNEYRLAIEAADAIEELQAAKCPHYIRNVHDRGDDSLCEKWGCEVKEVQPVRHGRWIKDCKVAFFWECSECGCYVFWEPQSYLLRPEDKMNYCPNCGARLDLEEDNG